MYFNNIFYYITVDDFQMYSIKKIDNDVQSGCK